jgi:murein DD-endopeptidase MepM/ murein hydrolase activator NlpD
MMFLKKSKKIKIFINSKYNNMSNKYQRLTQNILTCIFVFFIIGLNTTLAEIKLRYPLDSWYKVSQQIVRIPDKPGGAEYLGPNDSGVISYFDHDKDYNMKDAQGNVISTRTKNYKCVGNVLYDGHSGVDFNLGWWGSNFPTIFDKPIYSSAPGKVVTLESFCSPTGGYVNNGCGGGLGNHVVLEHDSNTRTLYGHLAGTSNALESGKQVACSQEIGTAGNSGNSSGPHLHFGVKEKINNVWQDRDPYGYSCGTNSVSNPHYPSYWYKMVGGSTEQPSTECAAPISTLPKPVIELVSYYPPNGYSIGQAWLTTTLSTSQLGSLDTPINTTVYVERRFNSGAWTQVSEQKDYFRNSDIGWGSIKGGAITQSGTYCMRVRSQNIDSQVYSPYSDESCLIITDVNKTASSIPNRELKLYSWFVLNQSERYVGLAVDLLSDMSNPVVVFQSKISSTGSQSWGDISTQQDGSRYIDKTAYKNGDRVCYRAKLYSGSQVASDWSKESCVFIGVQSTNEIRKYPPTNLRVTSQGTATDPEIKIMFDDNARGETGFRLTRYVGTSSTPEYVYNGIAGSPDDDSDVVVLENNIKNTSVNVHQQLVHDKVGDQFNVKSGTQYCYELQTIYQSSLTATPELSPKTPRVCTTTLGTSTTPPTTLTPPTNLTTPTLGPTALILTWIDTTTTETGFDVERKTGTSGTYTKLSQSPAKSGSGSTGSYISSGLTPSTLYCYRVRAVQNTTYSAYTPDYCITTKPATTVTPPSIPTNLSVTLPTTNPSTTLNISFKDTSTNETGFEIERKTGAGGTYTQLTTLPLSAGSGITPTYTSTLLSPSTTYCYRVRALGTTNSAYTTDVCTTTAATPSSTLPTPPTNLTVTNPTTNPTTSLQISWKDMSTNETGFDLRRKVGPATSSNSIAGLNQQSKAGSGSTITITSTGLTTKTQYCYQIAAKPTTAQSVYTSWVCGVTK